MIKKLKWIEACLANCIPDIFFSNWSNKERSLDLLIISIVPIYFYSTSINFHTFSWIRNIVDIDRVLYRKELSRKWVYISMAIVQTINLTLYFFIALITAIISLNFEQMIDDIYIIFNYIYIIQLIVQGFIFFIVGLIFLNKVKKFRELNLFISQLKKIFSFRKWIQIKNRIIANMAVMIAVFTIRGVSNFIFNHSSSLDLIINYDSVKADDWIFPIWMIIWCTWEDFAPVITQILIVRSVYNDLKTPENQNEGSRPSSKVSLETFLLSSEGNNRVVLSFAS